MEMRVVEIDSQTEGTFFRCLHDELSDDPEIVGIRRRWFEAFRTKGLRGRVLIADSDDVVGMCQYLPIEHSPFLGRDLMAILCLWVHGYEHHVGNQQKKGYGRLLLESVEADARESGMKGVATWGKDFPYWNPISFYEHMGYVRTDSMGLNILAWKAFDGSAEPPMIRRRLTPVPVGEDKVAVTAFQCGWCNGGIANCQVAAQVLAEMGDTATFALVDESSSPSICDNLYIDGVPFHPDAPPPTAEELREAICQRHAERSASRA